MADPKNSPWAMNTTVFQNRALFFKTIMRQILDKVCVSMPCQIISYDRSSHIAIAQPMLNYTTKSREDSSCSNIKIEIVRLMAGGFLIDFPIKKGDTGWLFAVDRDCYQVKQLSKPSLPSNSQVNCYKTGFWIPDQWGSEEKLGVENVDDGRLIIMSKDGSQKISIGNEDIKIYGTSISIYGDVNIDGDLNVTGKIKEVNANITLSTHTHKENGVTGTPESQPPTTGT